MLFILSDLKSSYNNPLPGNSIDFTFKKLTKLQVLLGSVKRVGESDFLTDNIIEGC